MCYQALVWWRVAAARNRRTEGERRVGTLKSRHEHGSSSFGVLAIQPGDPRPCYGRSIVRCAATCFRAAATDLRGVRGDVHRAVPVPVLEPTETSGGARIRGEHAAAGRLRNAVEGATNITASLKAQTPCYTLGEARKSRILAGWTV